VKAIKKASFHGAMYTFSPVDTSTIVKELGDKASGLAIAQIVPIPRGVQNKIVVEYMQALKELGHGTPSFYGLEGFIEAKVLVEGLKRAGASPSPIALVKSLETLRDFDLGGYYVTYKPDVHTGSRFVELDVIGARGDVVR
jgi:hypothetical protein